ncbi:hypothetical protein CHINAEXTREME_10620 [Halobiforma lacisalsi AJ5]|uniref:DUF7979 domain-containing protein n=1 Tax=Natronobacterium lacisalsi AJ5 TaxID=358396 RepID=M0L6Y1_NATLA|nr:hypothetical protein [Halobiforma lacisalsi]APW98214.1 hypothetical protein CHINAEXTREME_10620 [Halobiforma lacisalsi AJ5]EMA28199.1 hypothetical protein C445_19208 [Halobiforma lacisalsi AJ5]
MSVDITLERVDDVPAESRICHYDELGEAAKERLPALTDDPGTDVDGTVADGFQDCDLVKFTEYYEVSLH